MAHQMRGLWLLISNLPRNWPCGPHSPYTCSTVLLWTKDAGKESSCPSPHSQCIHLEKRRKKQDKYTEHNVQHQSSGAIWKSQTWAPILNSSYSFCGHKATLEKYSMVTSADIIMSWDTIEICINLTKIQERSWDNLTTSILSRTASCMNSCL